MADNRTKHPDLCTPRKLARMIICATSETYFSNLSPDLVYGIIKTESDCRHYVVRYEPGYRYLFKPHHVCPPGCSVDTEIALQKTSFGLMQVMGAVFREHGYQDWLSFVLLKPWLQVRYGCAHLNRKITEWGLTGGIAAYNAGRPVFREGTREFVNQEYVDKVLGFAKGWEEYCVASGIRMGKGYNGIQVQE